MNLREVEQMLAEHRLTVIKIDRNRHWKARVRTPAGTERVVMFPTSPSDHRALKNKSAQLRNIASGAV